MGQHMTNQTKYAIKHITGGTKKNLLWSEKQKEATSCQT